MRFLLVLALLVAPLVAVPAAAEASEADRASARRLLEAGKTAFKARSYQDAARYFDSALKMDPALSIARFNRAFSLRKLGDLKGAVVEYRAFLQTAPDDVDAVFGVAECERGLGNADEARAFYARYVALEKRPRKARHVERAKAFIGRPTVASADESLVAGDEAFRAGRYAEAAERYRAAYEAAPNSMAALYRGALSLRRAERYDEAQAAYQRFLKLVPEDPDATYGLAETARMKGDLELAISSYQTYAKVESRPAKEKYKRRATQWASQLEKKLAAAAPAPGVAVPPAEPKAPASPTPDKAQMDEAPTSPRLARLLGAPAPEPKPVPEPTPEAAPQDKPEDASASPRLAALLGRSKPEPGPKPAAEPKPRPVENEPLKPLDALRFASALEATPAGRAKVAASLATQPARTEEGRLFAANRALAVDPRSPKAHGLKIDALRALGRAEDAARAEQVASELKVEPIAPQSTTERAAAENSAAGGSASNQAAAEEAISVAAGALNRRDHAAAEAAAQQALALTPGDYKALLILGRAQRARDPAASKAVFTRALAVAPDHATPLYELALSHRAAGGDRRAENWYLKLYVDKTHAPDRVATLVAAARRRLEDP